MEVKNKERLVTNISGFENIQTKILSKVNTERKLDKPIVAFKIQKTSPKVKKILHDSVIQAFPDPEQKTLKIKNVSNEFIASINESYYKSFTKIEKDEVQKFSYTEPSWSGIPKHIYKLDILKSGMILKTLDLSFKSYHSIGKSLDCDIPLTHETVSEYHAILQYRKIDEDINQKGIYIYDLNSKNGTFVNGKLIKPYIYVFLHGGYIISFGKSTKKYIFKTSKDNEEKEAELSLTELQEMKSLEYQEQKKLECQYLLQENEKKLKTENESQGINWGIAEDFNENSNVIKSLENPKCNHETLILQEPKKVLKDWFKWEGYELNYQTEDKGFGQFYCCLDLTLDAAGSTETIEVNVIGDRMKAINECALKACNVLNQYGLLKQAYEEKQSLCRNWEEVDYYDSDEDNYLDRTGVIEKKRQQRMRMAGNYNIEMKTHKSLLEKYAKIIEQRQNLEKLISLQNTKEEKEDESDVDPLDVFMAKLNKSVLNGNEFQIMKKKLCNLRHEEIQILNSINVKKAFAKDSDAYVLKITDKTKNGYRFKVLN